MSTVTEIAPDVYRISTYEPQYKLQFNQFLVKDKEPCSFKRLCERCRLEPLVQGTALLGSAVARVNPIVR